MQYSQNSTVAFGLIHVASDETRFTLALKIVFFCFQFFGSHFFSLFFLISFVVLFFIYYIILLTQFKSLVALQQMANVNGGQM